MAEQEEWSSNANQAIDISCLQAGEDAPAVTSTFRPKYTHSIFDEEQIFGYQGLRIRLRFAAHDFQPNVQISFQKKFKAVGETRATDIIQKLKEVLPASAFNISSNFEEHIQAGAPDFIPPGELVETYTSSGRYFEIWLGKLTDPAVRHIIDRMQVLVLFFIDGGSLLDLFDQEWTLDRWRVFFLYEKIASPLSPQASPYSIVGYSTSYRYTYFDFKQVNASKSLEQADFTLPLRKPLLPSHLASRDRISQFLILPPHQHHSHGTYLYRTMYKTFLSDSSSVEMTVEDPNEVFDDLRDYCDYTHLAANGTLSQIKLNTDLIPALTAKRIGVRVPTSKLLDQVLLATLRRQNKIAPRQFARLAELHVFSQIPKSNRQAGTARLTQKARAKDAADRTFYYWRLLVKQRVYRKNKDVLMQLERVERIDKLEETVGTLVGDYERLLRAFKARAERDGRTTVNGRGVDDVVIRQRAKRKVIEDDGEDEDSGRQAEWEDGDVEGREAKRSRIHSPQPEG